MKSVATAERAWCIGLFIACAALNLWFSSVGLRNNLMEGHEFRQTQTALTAQYFQRDGWRLDYPLPLFGPPWSAPMEFPLYQYCAARFGTLAALPLEPAGRLVSLAFFYLTLPALFLLLGHFPLPPHRRWLFLALVLVSPAYVYYSRSFMIESTALCAAAWFLHAYCRSLLTPRPGWIAWAAVSGALAAITKGTTFMIFLVPAAGFTLLQLWRSRRARTGSWAATRTLVITGLAAAIPAVLAGAAWLHFGDTVKAGNPLSRFLLTSELRPWAFGTLAERCSPSFWETILGTTTTSTLHAANLLLFVTLGLLVRRPVRNGCWLLAGCFLAGPLLLANLYLIHDYYFYATGIFLLAGMALAWSELLELPSVSPAGKWLVIMIGLAVQAHGFAHSYFLLQDPRRPEPPELARVLAATTRPDDVVLIYGLDWNPVVPYYAGRRAIMVSGSYVNDPSALDAVVRRLPRGSIGAIVNVGEISRSPASLQTLARALDLGDEPLLTSDDTQVYLAHRQIPAAARSLAQVRLVRFSLKLPADDEVAGVKRRHYFVAKSADAAPFDMMSPLPLEVVAPFGIAVSLVDGKRVFNAHAPTDVIFEIPPGARTIHVGYGLLPEAYENGHSSEGVQFIVEWAPPGGRHQVLFDRFLNPSSRPEDRGLHAAAIPVPAGATGRLVFRTLPSPRNDISFNWAYWTELTIK
jgi:hypothetical protein